MSDRNKNLISEKGIASLSSCCQSDPATTMTTTTTTTTTTMTMTTPTPTTASTPTTATATVSKHLPEIRPIQQNHNNNPKTNNNNNNNNNSNNKNNSTIINGYPVGNGSSPTRKEGLYAKKDSVGYHSPNIYASKDVLGASNRKDHEWTNGIGTEAKDQLKKGPAPLVGWQNGSPTLFPSSPTKETSDSSSKLSNFELASSSKSSSRSGQDTCNNTEDLSSFADERLVESTPILTTPSLSSPEIKDLETSNLDLTERVDGLLSPVTDCTEDRIPATPDGSYLTSPNLTVGPSPASKSGEAFDEQRSESTRRLSPEKTCGILVHRKYSEPETTITANFNYNGHHRYNHNQHQPEVRYKDSIDGSESVLNGYDEDDDDDDGDENDDDNGVGKNVRKKPKIPDGGWGWMVVLASLVISMIADGVSFSFGLLYIEFNNEFGLSKSKTAWIGSLFMAVPLLSGPVMSALVDRYGCRNMTFLGGLVSGLGFVLSSFSRTIEVMYLTFGVVTGLGLGLCYVTAVVSIAYWFDKKRTLAVGLGACGTGIGTFVYAPMTTFFIDKYGWRGTCLLLAGTFFNLIVCGTVMRDPEWWILEQEKNNNALSSPRKSVARSEGDRRSSMSVLEEFPGVEELRRLLKSGKAPEYMLQSLRTSTETPSNAQGGTAFRSVVNLPTFVRQSEKVILFMQIGNHF